MAMDEQRLWTMMSRKLTGEATEEEIRQLDEWLKADPQAMYCYQVFLQLWQTRGGSLHPEELAVKFTRQQERIRAAEIAEGQVRGHRLHRTNGWRVVLAAAMMTGMAVMIWFLQKPFRFHHTPTSIPWATLTTPAGIRAHVILPDSTEVWLNAGSEITYRKDMDTASLREITLSGEAYFEVQHRDHQPMVIHTRHLDIRDLGTAFNIRAYPDDPVTEATLIAGSIEVINRKHPEEKIRLKPSQRITFYHDTWMVNDNASRPGHSSSNEGKNYVLTVVKPDPKESLIPDTAWKVNKLVFQSERFDELVKQLERWYNVHITLKSKRVAAYKLTGSFENESIEQALKALQITAPFRYRIADDSIWIDEP